MNENNTNEQGMASEQPQAESVTVKPADTKEFNLAKEVFEWFYTIAIALVVAFVIKAFLFDVVMVDGPSMFPTLVDRDRLIVTKLGYKPEQGDIIVLDSTYKKREAFYEKYEEENNEDLSGFDKLFMYFSLDKTLKHRYYVKRIIATEGQTVDIIDNKVYVDGEPLDESEYYTGLTYVTDKNVEYPFTVSDDCVFVMGDNRPQSKDSRSSDLGEVPVEAIFGKCQIRILPISSAGRVK